jgi:hypothetical protein
MTITHTPKKRNWVLTLVSIFPLALFLYLGVGVWLVKSSGSIVEVYVRFIVSAICLFGVFVFARIIWRGRTKKSLADILSDIVASI